MESIESWEEEEIIPKKKNRRAPLESLEENDIGITGRELDLRFGKKMRHFKEELQKDPSIGENVALLRALATRYRIKNMYHSAEFEKTIVFHSCFLENF